MFALGGWNMQLLQRHMGVWFRGIISHLQCLFGNEIWDGPGFDSQCVQFFLLLLCCPRHGVRGCCADAPVQQINGREYLHWNILNGSPITLISYFRFIYSYFPPYSRENVGSMYGNDRRARKVISRTNAQTNLKENRSKLTFLNAHFFPNLYVSIHISTSILRAPAKRQTHSYYR